MIVPNQKIIVRWVPSNKEYYINKGYKFTQWEDEFEVDIADISHGNHTKVECICDVCGKYFYRSIKSIYKGNPDYFCCGDQECKKQIRKATNQDRYGVENVFQSEEKKEKIKQTNLRKYGVENPNQSEIIRKKTKQTNLERYGYENPFQVEQFKEKSKQTNLKRYGFEFAIQNEEIKEKQKQIMLEKYNVEYPLQNLNFLNKAKQTNLERYNVENAAQSPIIQEKIKQTSLERYGCERPVQSEIVKEKTKQTNLKRYGAVCYLCSEDMKNKMIEKHGSLKNYYISSFKKYCKNVIIKGRASKQQKEICDWVNGILNYKINHKSRYFLLDILTDKNIYIEYDGFGHWLSIKNKWITRSKYNKKQLKRNKYLEKQGYKLIRVINRNKNKIDKNEFIALYNYCKNYLLNTEYKWIKIYYDKEIIITNKYIKTFKEVLNG